jgi:hypothetical protein
LDKYELWNPIDTDMSVKEGGGMQERHHKQTKKIKKDKIGREKDIFFFFSPLSFFTRVSPTDRNTMI